MKMLSAKQNWRSKVRWEKIFFFYQKWVYRNFAIIAKFWQSESFDGLRKFRYARAKFTVPLCWILRLLFHWPLFPASCILHQAACYFFFLFSSCFEILHSLLAEIDIRPYEIDGNQPDFGYDWIDMIIWLPLHAKTTKKASECN